MHTLSNNPFSNSLKFHHIGIACENLDEEMGYLSFFGYKQEGEDFIDPVQGIKGKFLISKNQPRMEILINYGSKGTLNPWLKKGIKMYHICYKASNFNLAIKGLEKIGAKIIVQPVKAIAFDNAEITFLMLPNKLFIELINKI